MTAISLEDEDRRSAFSVPEWGDPALRSLVELEKHIGWTAVVLDRLHRRQSTSINNNFGENQTISALQGMDDHALLLHLDQSWRWFCRVKRDGVLDRTFGGLLRSLSKDIVFLRNKRQHSDEYLDSAKSRENLKIESYKDMTWYISPDWSSTINGVRTLGGRLKIHDVEPAIDELYNQLDDVGLWIMPWTPIELAQRR